MKIPLLLFAEDRFIALIIFAFLVTQEVSGIAGVRGLSEALLFLIAIVELAKSGEGRSRLLTNPLAVGTLVFVASAIFACVISPLPAVSFSEMRMPLLKGMLAIPLAFSLAVLGLIRRQWTNERVALLIISALAISGLAQLIWVLWTYINHYLETGTFPADPFFHRYKIGAVMIVFPFVLVGIRYLEGKLALLMGLTAPGLLIVTITSNARGAWLGVLASVIYLAWVRRQQWRLTFKTSQIMILTVLIGALILLFLFSGTPIIEMLSVKINQGFDTSSRFGNGVWGATLDMIKIEPWLGYGYGDAVFAQVYNALAPSHPEWIVRESIGAHNAFLAHWAAAGMGGLLAIIALYATYIVTARRLLRKNMYSPVVQDLVHASVAAFLSYYLVRGQVEIVRWDSFGILMACILWLCTRPQCSRSAIEKV